MENRTKVAYLGLGANLGDREAAIGEAVRLLNEGVGEVRKVSTCYETMPLYVTNQPKFMNACCELETDLSPHDLLTQILAIEEKLGRERLIPKGPRSIDIDILLFGDEVMSEDDLQIPHPLLHERLFVLEPLQEIAPHVIHPCLGMTIQALYEGLRDGI